MPLKAGALIELQLDPEPVRIYKPSHKDLSGVALELDLRLDPELDEDKGFIRGVSGGLFLTLVGQKSLKSADADATFDWGNESAKISAKLGVTDISALLVAMRCQWYRRPIPPAILKKGDEKRATVSLFHKYADDAGSSSTVIEYELAPGKAYLGLSRSATNRKRITLEMHEILQVETRLQEALRLFQLVGKR